MKLLISFAIAVLLFGASISAQSTEEQDRPKAATIHNVEDVLAVLPPEPPRAKAANWTEIQKNEANSVLAEKLVETHTHGHLRVNVSEIANWPGLTLFYEVPNKEGY